MTKRTSVLYNGSCPICSREIAHYRNEAETAGLPVDFADLSEGEGAAFGVTQDQAARRLHVLEDGEVHAGVEAFIRLWSALPRWRWLARFTAFPGIRQVAEVVYEYLLAPVLYALHRRREARRLREG